MRAHRIALLATLLAACDTTGRRYVEAELQGAGTDERTITVGEWTLALERAEVAFGPMWLCSTESASPEFCDSAVLEFIEAATIDALECMPQPLGSVHGITGTARSAMYDHGIAWLPTEQRPRALDGAADGHSARLSATATHPDGRTRRITADVDLVPLMQGSVLVTGRRIGARTITTAPFALTVRVDPAAWWSRVDLERIAARGDDEVVLRQGDPDYEALVVAISAGDLPVLEWTE